VEPKTKPPFQRSQNQSHLSKGAKTKATFPKGGAKTKSTKAFLYVYYSIHMNYIPFSYIFSYWILVWFLLFWFYIVTIPPTLTLFIGFIGDLLLLFYLFYKTTMYNTIPFFIVILIIKVLPLYLLYKTKPKKTSFSKEIAYTIILFIVYLGWLKYNNTDIISIYKDQMQSLIHRDDRTPMIYLYKKYLSLQ